MAAAVEENRSDESRTAMFRPIFLAETYVHPRGRCERVQCLSKVGAIQHSSLCRFSITRTAVLSRERRRRRTSRAALQAHTVPLFLEGPTRRMKVLKTKEEKKALYEQVG